MTGTANYEITAVKDGGLVDNPKAPGQLQRQYVTVKGPDGTETADVYLRRKPQNAASLGDVIFATLKETEQGWRLYPEQNRDASQNGSGGSQGKDDYWAKREQRDVESQARQGRAHAQEMAIRWSALVGNDRMDQLLDLTNQFHQDVQRFPEADVGGGRVDSSRTTRDPGGAQPPATVDVSTGFASDKQKLFFERLLKDAGLTTQQVAEIVRYVTEALATDRVSRAIDAIKEGDRDKALEALLIQSAEWHSKQSDLPWQDDGGLPPA